MESASPQQKILALTGFLQHLRNTPTSEWQGPGENFPFLEMMVEWLQELPNRDFQANIFRQSIERLVATLESTQDPAIWDLIEKDAPLPQEEQGESYADAYRNAEKQLNSMLDEASRREIKTTPPPPLPISTPTPTPIPTSIPTPTPSRFGPPPSLTCNRNDPEVQTFLTLMKDLKWDAQAVQSFARLFQYLYASPGLPFWKARFYQGQYIDSPKLLPSYLYMLVQLNCPYLRQINEKLRCMLRRQREKRLGGHPLPYTYTFPNVSDAERKRVKSYYKESEDPTLKPCYDKYLDDVVHFTNLLERGHYSTQNLYSMLNLFERDQRIVPRTHRYQFRGLGTRPELQVPKARGWGEGDPSQDKPNLFYTIMERHCNENRLGQLNQYIKDKQVKRAKNIPTSAEELLHRYTDNMQRRRLFEKNISSTSS